MIEYRKQDGLNKFFALAVVEHVVFIVIFAIIIYQEPPLKVDSAPINVEILVAQKKDKKKEVVELPVVNPISQEFKTPLELPTLRSSQDVQSYLTSSDVSVGLPDLPQKSQLFQSNLDRTSLDVTASSGYKQGVSKINVDAPVRSRSVMEVE